MPGAGAKDGVIPAGLPAPAFTLPVAAGGTMTIPDPSACGLTLCIFYKNTCPTCRLVAPLLERLHQAVSGEGGRVVGISQDGPDGARGFAQEMGLTFPILVDKEGYPVSIAYELLAVPTANAERRSVHRSPATPPSPGSSSTPRSDRTASLRPWCSSRCPARC